MANQVTLTFAGDSKSLERTFDRVGAGAKDMAADMDKASADVRSFGGAMDSAGNAADASESKFQGAADLLDGLGGAFGLPTEGATNMFRAFGDLSGGFATLQPLVGTLGNLMRNGLGGALSFIAAHPVLITIGLLAAGFVLLWQNSETFRDIVRSAIDRVGEAVGNLKDAFGGALGWIKDKAEGLWNFFRDLPGNLRSIGENVKDAILWPYKTAFNAIARLWNNTVGNLSFEIPSWVPGMGGKGFSMPRLPTFHQGGTVPGSPGHAVPILAMAGETVVPAGRGGGDTFIIQAGAIVTENQLADLVHKVLLRKKGRNGELGLA